MVYNLAVERLALRMQIRTKNKVYTLAMTAMMAAVIAAVSPFAIPIGPTPITLCTLALYFSLYPGLETGRSGHAGLHPAGDGRDPGIQRL